MFWFHTLTTFYFIVKKNCIKGAMMGFRFSPLYQWNLWFPGVFGPQWMISPLPRKKNLSLCPMCNFAPMFLELCSNIPYILEGNLENFSVWIFSVPFSLKGSSKCTNRVNVHKLYAVEYINTICSLDYPFQFRIF